MGNFKCPYDIVNEPESKSRTERLDVLICGSCIVDIADETRVEEHVRLQRLHGGHGRKALVVAQLRRAAEAVVASQGAGVIAASDLRAAESKELAIHQRGGSDLALRGKREAHWARDLMRNANATRQFGKIGARPR